MGNYKYKELFESLKSRLVSSCYELDRRLPGKKKLSEEFGVSEITVARALKELKDAGFIHIKERSGAYPSKTLGILRRIFILHIASKGAQRWLSPFFEGLYEAADEKNIPCEKLVVESLPEDAEKIFSEGDGVVFAGWDVPELRAKLREKKIPHIVCCSNSGRGFSLGLNHFSVARSMLCAMSDAGAKIPAFLGTFCHDNHKAAREGFNSAADMLGLYDRYVLNIWDAIFEGKMEELLKSRPAPDSFMFVGENLFRLAPDFINRYSGKYIFGVVDDSKCSPDISSCAFTVRHSMKDDGLRIVSALLEIADKKLSFYEGSSPFIIRSPENNTRPSAQ